ncbi:MAG: nuclear transport factor 2 family protein, partial [Bacteroidota bacterium]
MSNAKHQALITQFYEAFQKGDAAAMGACYHEEITFEDPGFGHLKGKEVTAMWQMLIERSKGNLSVTFDRVKADDVRGSANWEAKYPFSKTKRPVHNKIKANFQFKDGKIIDHKDEFSFWRWSSMALGPV